MSKKLRKIIVDGKEITIQTYDKEDYISLTDMAKSQLQDVVIIKWLSLKNTIEYLGEWELLYNPDFNYTEFGIIKNEAGSNNFVLSVKQWMEKTNAIGLSATAGRYGSTYGHKDIAFHFGMWISPKFQLYIVKEYQRLKDFESNQYNLEWNVKRILSKANYHIHTDAIKNYILPKLSIEKQQESIVYAEEADILNLALFGCTAKQWRELNKNHNKQGLNIRDIASINELAVLSNLENLNAEWIKENLPKQERFLKLKQLAVYQLEVLSKHDFVKNLKKDNLTTNIQKNIE
ncbi:MULTISPECIES: KilA-N domain-containing protein [unclassified Flavobacterium]|uniref:KilA-N domain-containing protein n=3 Tax=Flavobacterium TaxID=237 RepID=UPI0025BC0D18|nr:MULTISPECIES: KilA-N domain-containing protein [unclassified Flavobacterium]